LRCYYIDFDGAHFIPILHDYRIHPFEGERDITSLEIFPSRFLVNADQIKLDLRKNGEMFRDFIKFKQFYYSGVSLIGHPCGCSANPPNEEFENQHPEYIESPVIVDFSEALRTHHGWLPELTSLEPLVGDGNELRQPYEINLSKQRSTGKMTISVQVFDSTHYDFAIDQKMMQDFISNDHFLRRYMEGVSSTFADLSGDDLVLLPHRIFAFVLRSRKFGKPPLLVVLKFS